MNDVSNVQTVTVRREIAAPAEELFDAWLDPESLAIWMRPGSIARTTAKVDPRIGGQFEILMHAESGPIPHTGTYRQIDRPWRLVFTWNSAHAGKADSLVTVEFRPKRGVTEIVLTHERLPSADSAAQHNKGWSAIVERLAQTFGKARASA